MYIVCYESTLENAPSPTYGSRMILTSSPENNRNLLILRPDETSARNDMETSKRKGKLTRGVNQPINQPTNH